MHFEPDLYRIERLSPQNLDDLGRLYHAVYGEKKAPPDFRQKYATAWSGAAYIGYFAYDRQGQPAAYYGVLPCLLQYGDTKILSAQSGDTMTHPAHRNKGLFFQLCTLTIELCSTTGIRLLFGFPNQNSYRGFVEKLKWTVTEHLDCFTIPVTTIPLHGLAKQLPILSRLYSKYATALLRPRLAPQPGVASSVLTPAIGGLYRDQPYLEYKTYSPTKVLRLGAAKAWVKITDSFIIGDLQLNGQDLDETIRRLKKIAARLGHRRLYFHSSPGTIIHRQFAQRYKSFPSFPVIFKDLGAGIPIHNIKFTFADIDIF